MIDQFEPPSLEHVERETPEYVPFSMPEHLIVQVVAPTLSIAHPPAEAPPQRQIDERPEPVKVTEQH